MRSPLVLVAAAGLLLGACSYDFSNPAEKLDAGEIAGRTVADASGTGSLTGVAGVTVKLRNSTAEVTTRDNGRFILLGAPVGRHTVLFSKGTSWALTRDVDVTWGSDGQPEGVILGDLRVRYPVAIVGTFSVPTSGTFRPTSVYAYDDETGTRATFPPALDLSGATQVSTFNYSFDSMAVGRHRLRFVVAGTDWDPYFATWGPATYMAGPVSMDVSVGQEGQSVPMQPLALAAPTAATGKLRFNVSAPASLAAPYALTVTVTAAPAGAPVPYTPDSTGTVEADLAPGAYYVDVVTTPTDGAFYDPPRLVGIVIADQTTELGTAYVVDYNVATKAVTACITTADCFGMETCSGGQCVFSESHGQPLFCVEDSIVQTECQLAMSIGCPTSAPFYTECGFVPPATYLGVCAWQEMPQPKWICVPKLEGVCMSAAGTEAFPPSCGLLP